MIWTSPENKIHSFLKEQPSPVSRTAISKALLIDTGLLSRYMHRLETKGLIERTTKEKCGYTKTMVFHFKSN
jgi:DNA-binding MarR family transcriptional regulator